MRGQEQLTTQRDLFEQDLNEFYAKKGQNTRFRSKKERDQWLLNELEIINKALKDKESLKETLEAERKHLVKYKTEFDSLTKRTAELRNEINKATRESFNINRRKDELNTKRNDLWRRENAWTQELAQIGYDHQMRTKFEVNYGSNHSTG